MMSEGKILVLTADRRLHQYNRFFGPYCVPKILEHWRMKEPDYVAQVRDEIMREYREGRISYVGVEDKRLFHSLGLASDMGYWIDAGEFWSNFMDWSEDGLPFVCVDMNDQCDPMFRPTTLRERDVILKGQVSREGTKDGLLFDDKVVWAPYWTGYTTFTVVVNREWGSVKPIFERRYDTGFVGTISTYRWRHTAVHDVFGGETWQNADSPHYVRFSSSRSRLSPGHFANMVRDSKVAINIRGSGVLAQRFFEILHLQTCCLTDDYTVRAYWLIPPVGGEAGECCEVFEGDNSDSLRAKMEGLLDNPGYMECLATNGKRFWECCCKQSRIREYGGFVLEAMESGLPWSEVLGRFRNSCLEALRSYGR